MMRLLHGGAARRIRCNREGYAMRYCELKQKEVVNVLDGKRLGTTVDLTFDPADGTIRSITVPGPFSITDTLRGKTTGYVIPWNKVCKIGDDVVLVELDAAFFRAYLRP
jgi:YlmC/YmxH family sporulation protein